MSLHLQKISIVASTVEMVKLWAWAEFSYSGLHILSGTFKYLLCVLLYNENSGYELNNFVLPERLAYRFQWLQLPTSKKPFIKIWTRAAMFLP